MCCSYEKWYGTYDEHAEHNPFSHAAGFHEARYPQAGDGMDNVYAFDGECIADDVAKVAEAEGKCCSSPPYGCENCVDCDDWEYWMKKPAVLE